MSNFLDYLNGTEGKPAVETGGEGVNEKILVELTSIRELLEELVELQYNKEDGKSESKSEPAETDQSPVQQLQTTQLGTETSGQNNNDSGLKESVNSPHNAMNASTGKNIGDLLW